TWYTWLEQGRPINASVQVIDAIASTLRLDAAERGHLFRLADLPGAAPAPADCGDCPLPATIQPILDAMPLPAYVTTERFDLLAWNALYDSLFAGVTQAPPGERNTILAVLTSPACCTPMQDPDDHCVVMVGQLRAAYGRHVGDPAWAHFIRRLEALSPTFAAAWSAHVVTQPTSFTKHLRHPGVGPINGTTTSFAVQAVPGARMVIYTPADEPSARAIARLAAGEELTTRFPCWNSHHPEHHPERMELTVTGAP
ncbi:MAG: helix-turn-helix transcriptional regulator, partial [Trebonia sp.]